MPLSMGVFVVVVYSGQRFGAYDSMEMRELILIAQEISSSLLFVSEVSIIESYSTLFKSLKNH